MPGNPLSYHSLKLWYYWKIPAVLFEGVYRMIKLVKRQSESQQLQSD